MINGAELLEAVAEIAVEKKIDKEVIFEGIVEGFQKAYERFFDTEAHVLVDIDEAAGTIRMFQELEVTKTVEDDWLEITEQQALSEFGKTAVLGTFVKREIEFNEEFSRLAVYQVRQNIQQRIRGAERENVYKKFISKEGEILSGKITGMNEQGTSYLIDIEGSQASIWNKKIIPGEKFNINQFVSFYVEEVSRDAKFSQIVVSRVAPEFLGKLLEEQVPEIAEGLVEIKAISREAGKRAKIAVVSRDADVDAIGAVVGQGGQRINQITNELQGEKIDVIKWDENMTTFIINAMAPVRVISITVDEENQECDVIVPDEQLSLAIGKSGIAARLVANLVKMRINIYSFTNAKIDGLEVLWNGNITEAELSDPAFLENINRRKNKTNNSGPKISAPRRNREADIDFEALAEFQQEIRDEQDAMTAEEIVIDQMLDEQAKESINIDEINANLEALEVTNLEDQTVEEDEEISDEYDEYYEA